MRPVFLSGFKRIWRALAPGPGRDRKGQHLGHHLSKIYAPVYKRFGIIQINNYLILWNCRQNIAFFNVKIH